MEQGTTEHKVNCSRCGRLIVFYNNPGPRTTCFLCNDCHLKWKEIEDKLIGKAYEDEIRKAFINFVDSKPWTFNNKTVI